jgi:membrane dipeptidase
MRGQSENKSLIAAENYGFMNVDAHSDIPLKLYMAKEAGNPNFFHDFHLPRLMQANVKIEMVMIGGDFELASYDFSSFDLTNKIADFFKETIKQHSDTCTLITTKDDLENVVSHEKIGFILGIEGAKSVEASMKNWNMLYQKGVRSILLTHNNGNALAAGCRNKKDTGLTSLGKDFVAHLNAMDIILDVAHLSRQGFFDVIDTYEKPFIASHTGIAEIREHFRNITDEQITSIAGRGGVIGLICNSEFISDEPSTADLSNLLQHIDYLKNLVGCKYIGMGPDFADYFQDEVTQWLIDNDLPVDANKYLENCENITQINNVRNALKASGYFPYQINNIMGKNMLRIYKKLLPK